MLGEEIAEKYALRRKAFGEHVVWKKFTSSSLKAARHVGSRPTSGVPASISVSAWSEFAPQSLGYAEPSQSYRGRPQQSGRSGIAT